MQDTPDTPPSPMHTDSSSTQKPRPTLPLKIHRQIECLEKRIQKLTKENAILKEKLEYYKHANTRIRKLPK